TLTLNGGTLRIPGGNPFYYMAGLATDASGGTVDLSGSTAFLEFTGAAPRIAINGNSLWAGSVNSAFVNRSSSPATLAIAPNVTLTSQVHLANSFRIVGGGTLFMT